MIKKLILALLLVSLASSAFAVLPGSTTYFRGLLMADSLKTSGDIEITTDANVGNDVNVGKALNLGTSVDSNACITARIVNKDGATLLKGDPVIADITGWQFMTVKVSAKGMDSTTVNHGFSTFTIEGTPFSIKSVTVGTPTANDSMWVYGTKFGASTATTEIITGGTGASPQSSPQPVGPNTYVTNNLWSDVDSIDLADYNDAGIDSVQFYAYPLGGVTAAITASSQGVLGIVHSTSIADNATGEIAIGGRCLADVEVVDATTPVVPGDLLTVNARGNLRNDGVYAGSDTIAVIGHALEWLGSDDSDDSGLIWIELYK